MAKKKKQSANKKVRNAKKSVKDGIEFKSKLEVYCYDKLKENNIEAEYEKHKFEIIPSFTYDNSKIRKMTYTPDFVGKNFVIECKGNPNDAFPLRWKIFKYYLYKNNIKYNLYLPRNKKQIDETINKIKYNELVNSKENSNIRINTTRTGNKQSEKGYKRTKKRDKETKKKNKVN